VSREAGLPAEAASTAKQASREGGSNSVVESQPSKLLVAGSIPVSRSRFSPGDGVPQTPLSPSLAGPPCPTALRAGALGRAEMRTGDWKLLSRATGLPRRSSRGERRRADVAQLAERVLGKDEVTSSILVIGSRLRSLVSHASFVSASQRRLSRRSCEAAQADRSVR
jgi:hypothetical protein